MKKNLVIHDADSMIFIIASRNKRTKVPAMVQQAVSKYIKSVNEHCGLNTPGETDYVGFYGSKEEGAVKNFRYDIFPDYKGKRVEPEDHVKKWRPIIHATFKDKWGFLPVEGMEADDAVGIAYEKYKDEYENIYVATMDKDLKQFPEVYWYNIQEHSITKFNEFQANKFFADQMLKGDSGDGIPGLVGIGPKKAQNMIEPCTNNVQLKWTVLRAYASYESDLLAAAYRAIKPTKRKEIVAEIIEEGQKLGFTISKTQAEHKMRLQINDSMKDTVEEKLPGGWKAYIKLQYRLLHMLREPLEGSDFEVPEVQSVPLPLDEDGEVEDPKQKEEDILDL